MYFFTIYLYEGKVNSLYSISFHAFHGAFDKQISAYDYLQHTDI